MNRPVSKKEMEEFKKNPSVKIMVSPYPNRKMRHMRRKAKSTTVKYVQEIVDKETKKIVKRIAHY